MILTIIFFSFDIIQYFQIVLALFTLTDTIYYFEEILILRVMVIVSIPIKFSSVIASFFSRKKKFMPNIRVLLRWALTYVLKCCMIKIKPDQRRKVDALLKRIIIIRHHPFNTYAQFFEKANISHPLIRTRTLQVFLEIQVFLKIFSTCYIDDS